MSLYAGLAGALLWAVSVGGAFVYGEGLGEDRAAAQTLREDRVATLATEAASHAAAEAISKIEVKNVTITQATQTLVREKLVYSTCRNDPGVMRNINEARTGRAEPADGGELPSPSADLRR